MKPGYIWEVFENVRNNWMLEYKGALSTFDQQRFAQKSYTLSGLDELKKYLLDNWNSDNMCISIIEKWRAMMNDFSCIARTDEARFIFSVYYDVANDVLDYLVLERGGKNE